MKNCKLIFHSFLLLLFFNLLSCKPTNSKAPVLHPVDIQTVIRQMTDMMIHDITNPPLAARFFSYTCLAGYDPNPVVKRVAARGRRTTRKQRKRRSSAGCARQLRRTRKLTERERRESCPVKQRERATNRFRRPEVSCGTLSVCALP